MRIISQLLKSTARYLPITLVAYLCLISAGLCNQVVPQHCSFNSGQEIILIADSHIRNTSFQVPGTNIVMNPWINASRIVAYLDQTYPGKCRVLLGDIAYDSPSSPATPNHDYDLAGALFYPGTEIVLGNHDSPNMFCRILMNRTNCSDYSSFFYYSVPWFRGYGWYGFVLHSFFGPGTSVGAIPDEEFVAFENELQIARANKSRMAAFMHHDCTQSTTIEGCIEPTRARFMDLARRYPTTFNLVLKAHRHEWGYQIHQLGGDNKLIVIDVPSMGYKVVSNSFARGAFIGYVVLKMQGDSSFIVEAYSKFDPQVRDGLVQRVQFNLPPLVREISLQ